MLYHELVFSGKDGFNSSFLYTNYYRIIPNKCILLCRVYECVVASWLVRSSPDRRAVWVRALDWDILFCSWVRYFTLTVPLSTRVYKWVSANLMLGVTLDGLASHPRRGMGEVEILMVASFDRNGDI